MFGSKPPNPERQAREAPTPGEFRRLLDEEVDYVHRSLRRLGVVRSELDDVTQEVFMVVLRRWGDFDSSRPVRPWLFGIAYRTALSHFRKYRRESAAGTLDDQLHPQVDGGAQHESRALVLAALERIPLPRRAVFTLHCIDGVEMKEVAKELGIPLFTAYARLKRAREEFEAAVLALLGRRQFSDLMIQGVLK